MGNPKSFDFKRASPDDFAIADSGWRTFNSLISELNLSRSSAKSILSGEVPIIFPPEASISNASFKGVWPPKCTIIPSGFSLLIIETVSSIVRGSKYNLSEVS